MGRSDDMKLPADTPFLTDPRARAVMDALSSGGHAAFFVGGCVRNALLGTAATDIDISTDARPERIMKLAEAAGLKPVPTGIEHGTITVVSDGVPFEVTTYRRDVETDGRRAVVAFANSMAEDAMRRDFTINALYADAHGSVYDPVAGLSDIAARRVRFIGAASERIAEDHLRMLRFFRFTAWYADPAGGMDVEALAAIAEAAQDAANLSAERVGAEVLKLLCAPDPAPALAAMEQSRLGHVVLPGSDATPMARLVHVEELLGIAPDPVLRLAALTGDVSSLRLSRAQQRQHMLLRDWVGALDGPAALAYRHGSKTAFDVVALRAALLEQSWPADLDDQIGIGVVARFPLKASDLPLQGKALGDALRAAEAAWIASGFALSHEQLIAQALNG